MFVRDTQIVFAEIKFTNKARFNLALTGAAIVHVADVEVTVESGDFFISTLIVAL